VIDHIELSISARAELLQLVRLTAGVVAAKVSLGLDDLEDLRLGVQELCLSLMGPSEERPGRLALRYAWDDEMIEITCTFEVEPSARDLTPESEFVRHELSLQILDAVVDEHGEAHADGLHTAWLRMRRIRTGDG
jgi:hypothetical protein